MFWVLAIIITAIACAALFYAARGRPVNAAGADATTAHFRLQLREIEADIAAGRLGQAEGLAARTELGRELLRTQAEHAAPGRGPAGARLLPLSVLLVAGLAFGAYVVLGSPDAPSLPLASRTDIPPAEFDLETAIARIEQRLASTPDDLRGWTVIAPAYMQLGRFADARRAYQRILELDGATADGETNLAEAIMMANGGEPTEEALTLFRSAAERDPRHIRSRYYLAGEAMRRGDHAAAVAAWNELLGLAEGTESWVPVARQALAEATAALEGTASPPDGAAIEAMVEGLAQRLESGGGSIEEWTRLVRSQLVLGQTEAAQQSYEKARQAYPDAAVRTELDVLAADNGLQADGATN